MTTDVRRFYTIETRAEGSAWSCGRCGSTREGFAGFGPAHVSAVAHAQRCPERDRTAA